MVAIKQLGLAAGLITLSCQALAAGADEVNGVALRSEPDLETLLFSERAQDKNLEERDLTLEIELAERELEERARPGAKKPTPTSSRNGPSHISRPRSFDQDEDEVLYLRARPGAKKPSPTSSRNGPTHVARPRYYDEDERLYRRARPGAKKPSPTGSRNGPTHVARPRYYDKDERLYRRARPGAKKPSPTSSKNGPTHVARPRYYDEEDEKWA